MGARTWGTMDESVVGVDDSKPSAGVRSRTQSVCLLEDSRQCTSSSPGFKLAHPPWRIAFVLFKFIIGTGILAMPKSMQQTGVLLFVALLLFFGAIAWAGCVLIAMSLDLIGRSDINMGQLGQVALGRGGFWLAVAVGALDCWGAVLAYWTALVGIVQPYLQANTMLGTDSALTHTPELIAMIAVLIFPLTLLRNLSSLGVIATAGSLILFAFVTALIGMAIDHGHALGEVSAGRSGLQSALAAGSIAFSYDCQVSVFANYRELDRPSGHKAATLARCSGAAILASGVVYFATAVAGYSLYGEDIKDDVLNNMSLTALPIILNLAVFLVVVPDIPLLSFEVSAILQDHLLGHSLLANFSSNFLFIATSVVAAIYVPSMQTAFAYVGATTAVALNAILPPLFYLALSSSLAKEGRSESTSTRDAYIDMQLNDAPSAQGGHKKGMAVPMDNGKLIEDGQSSLPVLPSARLRKLCVGYLSFGCVCFPTLIVLVSLGQ